MTRRRKPAPLAGLATDTLATLADRGALAPAKGLTLGELPNGASLNGLNRLYSRGLIGRAGAPTVYFLTETGRKLILGGGA